MELLDPSHEQRFGGGEPAPRLTSLAGTTIGVISNGKENTKPFFDLLSAWRDAGELDGLELS